MPADGAIVTRAAESYEPSYSSIVVDANSGAVMQATNADSPRHPASLTKIMTLYLLFERLDAGKIKLSTELPVSAHAAAQAPSKLGLKPGQSIAVETAIRAIVTKSANDVAVMVAEALAGSEPEFAELMTAKAHALGMMHTNYHNASGLPDEQQITTARDQAILARAVQDRFPKYYHYFATRTFEFHGKEIRNHNHLLGVVPGVDGMKTGYIHESGFNIVISMRRGPRHIVAVVFGGRTASARDARVRSLIDNNINIAAVTHTAAADRRRLGDRGSARQGDQGKSRGGGARAAPRGARSRLHRADQGHPGEDFHRQRHARRSPSQPIETDRKLVTVEGPTKVTTVIVKRESRAGRKAKRARRVAGQGRLGRRQRAGRRRHAAACGQAARRLDDPGRRFPRRSKKPKQRLAAAQEKAKAQLGQANPFTERIAKGDKALYRARFAGLDKNQAETACKHLKRSDIPCMLLKN